MSQQTSNPLRTAIPKTQCPGSVLDRSCDDELLVDENSHLAPEPSSQLAIDNSQLSICNSPSSRTFVLGDIHGCDQALDVMLQRIRVNEKDTLIVLGDIIDRGPNSRRVIEILLDLETKCHLHVIRGNHEQMLLDAVGDSRSPAKKSAKKGTGAICRNGPEGAAHKLHLSPFSRPSDAVENSRELRYWLKCGGDTTLASYGNSFKDIPESHLQFLRRSEPYLETEHAIFIHASLEPGVPLEEQRSKWLQWQPLTGFERPHPSGKQVLCGHSGVSHDRPLTHNGWVCLDTLCWDGGYVSCLELPSGTLYQSTETGDFRVSSLGLASLSLRESRAVSSETASHAGLPGPTAGPSQREGVATFVAKPRTPAATTKLGDSRSFSPFGAKVAEGRMRGNERLKKGTGAICRNGPEGAAHKLRLSPFSRRTRRILWWSSISYLVVCLIVLLLLFVVSERWAFSAALTYLPRSPYLIPPLILALISLRIDWRPLPVNVLSMLLVLGPIMELHWPSQSTASSAVPAHTLKIVSCNMAVFSGDFETTIQEIRSLDPDVIAFQEATRPDGPNPLPAQFEGWHVQGRREFWVVSKFPVRVVEECLAHSLLGDKTRLSAVAFEIQHPEQPFLLVSVHPMSPRRALLKLDFASFFKGATAGYAAIQMWRASEMKTIRESISRLSASLPTVVVGDFNSTSTSNVYKRYWSEFTNAFDTAGSGYGYTAPCSFMDWHHGLPWARVDHILTPARWTVQECHVGEANGSDHRLIAATLSAPPEGS